LPRVVVLPTPFTPTSSHTFRRSRSGASRGLPLALIGLRMAKEGKPVPAGRIGQCYL
jgi:hypothetical protein